jgi:arginine/lysine/ornithine decarboxylase
MNKELQKHTPLLDALQNYKAMKIVPFDVPGHKQGKGNPELTEFLGKQCLSVDVNSMKPLDNLCHPVSVIKEAQALAADAFGASSAFFMVNGTSSAVQTMILCAVKAGDKIIMPRNVHRSAINALVLCGAEPVYVNPGVNKELGIPLGMAFEDVRKAIDSNPEAKAVFVNNPTYYGICSDLKSICDYAHSREMLVLVDEAHGTHFYFGENMPISAMAAGADLSAVSMHKTGGSLTQSSLLLSGGRINEGYIRKIINLTGTTSGSYLLMVSLDISRKNLALRGKEMFKKVVSLTQYARDELNKTDGYWAFEKDLINGGSVFDFDLTKLSIHTRSVGLAGIEVYDILRDEYGMQVEFGDLANILAIISMGDSALEVERLVSALHEIKRLYGKDKKGLYDHEYISPIVAMSPQKAFYNDNRYIPIESSSGRISAEFVMCYPPGIPILAPGEMITNEIIEYIRYAKEKGCVVLGPEDMEIEYINVTE